MRPFSSSDLSARRPRRLSRRLVAGIGLLLATVPVSGLPVIAPAVAASAPASETAQGRQAKDPVSAQGPRKPKRVGQEVGKDVPRGFVEGRSVEELSERTANSRTWKNADGSFTTRVSPDARFFPNGKNFEPIDNTLVPDAARGGFRNKGNSFVTRFDRSSSRVDLETAEGRISMVPVGGRASEGVVDQKGESITYADVWPGVDVRYRVVNEGIKEEIVLRELPTTSEFSFRVDGTALTVREDGGLATGGAFAGKWEVTPPVVFDKHGSLESDAGVRYQVNGQTVTLAVSDDWRKGLTKSDLPVVLDPTWNHVGSQYVVSYKRNPHDDGYTPCSAPCQPQVGIRADQQDGWQPWRSTIRFPYEHLFGITLSEAHLQIRMLQPDCRDSAGNECDPRPGHNGESTLDPTTIKVYPGDVNNVYGGDWNWEDLNPAGPLVTIPGVQDELTVENGPILTFYQQLLNSGKREVPLKLVGDETDGAVTFKRWFYFEMVFTYNRPPNMAKPVSPPSPDNGVIIDDTTPELLAVSSDPDESDTLHYLYTMCKNAALTLDCQNSGWITNGHGNPIKQWEPPTALTRGTTYYWNVKAASAGYNGQWEIANPDWVWSFTPALGTLKLTKELVNPAKIVYQSGEVLTYKITVTNPTAYPTNAVDLEDYLPGEVALIPGTVTTNCGNCVVNADGTSLLVDIPPMPQQTTLTFEFQAVALGAEHGCAVVHNAAAGYNSPAPAVWGTVPVTICGGGLGIEPWWTYVDETLGPQAVGRVNVANGNLVVQQTDGAPVPAHGRLGYVLRRTYNSQDAGTLPLAANTWGKGWVLNVGTADDPGGLGLATGLILPVPETDAASPGRVIYVDRDGTRHTFWPNTLSTAVDVTTASTASLGALVPKALPFGSAKVCATQTYNAPPGVHLALWRYVAIPLTKTCSAFNPATEGTVLGFAAMRPDRVRYEFHPNGRLASMVDAAGVELRYRYNTLGDLKTIFEPGSCSEPDDTNLKCRKFDFTYQSSTERWITDPAGRITKYFFDPAGHLTRVENPLDGGAIEYDYDQCGEGTRTDNLCSVSDPEGNVTGFSYTAGSAPGWSDRVETIDPRRPQIADTIGFAYTTSTEVRVDQGNQRRRYLLDTELDWGTLTGRVRTIEEGGAGTTPPVAPVLRRTSFEWEYYGWEGCTARGIDYTTPDNNLCGVRRTGSTNGVASPDEHITWTYTSEGAKLTERRITSDDWVKTTWGHRVQYAQADGTLRCLDYRTVGGGNPFVGSPSCNAPAWDQANTLYAISDNTEMLTPRGNRGSFWNSNPPLPGPCDEPYGATDGGSAADPDCYRTVYTRDIPAPIGNNQLASVNPTKTPASSPCGGTAGNTGLLCEARQPAFNSTGAPTTTRYTYDLFGQKTAMISPKAIAEGVTTTRADCPLAGGVRLACTSYGYYTDGERDLSGNVSAGGWLKSVTDPNGAFVAFGYDRGGNAVRTWDRIATKGLGVGDFPSGAGAARAFAEQRYSADTDAYANPWRYLVSESDPLKNKTSYTLDKNGNRTFIRPPRGNNGAVGTAYDIEQRFDEGDRMVSHAMPLENPAGDDNDAKTTNQYDVNGNLIKVVDPVGNVTIHRYDQVGRRTETRWRRGPNGTGVVIGTGCHAWTSADAPIPSNSVVCQTSQMYDGVDRVVTSTDARGTTTNLTYDDLGREIRRVVPRSDTEFVRTDTVYDLDGNVVGICPPRHFNSKGEGTCTNGSSDVHRQNRAYDHAGRLVHSTTYRDGGGVRTPLTTTYTYDADGNGIRRDDPQDSSDSTDDRSTTFTFDLLGRKTSELVPRKSGLTPPTKWNYDPVGNVTSVVRPGAPETEQDPQKVAAAERITAYRYDDAHRLILTVEGSDSLDTATAGLPATDGGRNVRTGLVYDPDGHVIARFEPRAYVPYLTGTDPRSTPNPAFMVRTDYDVDGRPIAQWVPRYETNGAVTDLSADGAQKAECPQIDATYPQHHPHIFDFPVGQPEPPAYPDGLGVCLSRAEYDDAGRVTKVILPTAGWNRSNREPVDDDRHLTYSYTGDNLISGETTPSPENPELRAPTTYVYNGAGQVERVDRPSSRTEKTRYSHDGLVIETTGSAGEVPHVQTFQYDAAGNRTQAKRTVDGTAEYDTWTYTPDNLVSDHVAGKTDNTAGNTTSYEYDLVGNPMRVYSPAANACLTATSPGTNCAAPGTRGHPARYTYTLDNLVRTTTVPIEADGSKKRETTYFYDLGGRKTEQAVREIDGTDGLFTAAGASNPPTTTAVNSFTLNRPASTQTGDVMLASIVVNDASPVPAIPAGWTEVRTDSIGSTLRQTIYLRVADATDTANKAYTWTLSSHRRVTGGIQSYRGISTTNPIVDHDATVDTTADPEVAAPFVDGLRSGIVVHFATVNGEGTISPPLGMTESWENASYNTSDTRDVVAQSSRASITGDGAVFTHPAQTTASGGHIGAVVSLRPAVPATPDPAPAGITLVNKTSTTTGNSSATSLAITRPTGTTAGDLMVAQVVSNDDSPDFTAPSIPGPWTLVRTSIITDTLRQSIYIRVATTADETTGSYTWTLSDYRRIAGGIATYRGVDTANLGGPVNDVTIDTTSGTSVTTPSIQAPAGSQVLQFSAIAAEGTFTGAPTGMTELWDQAAPNSSNTRDLIAATFDGPQVTAGSTGSRTATASNAGKRIGVVLALPAAEVTYGPASVPGATSQKFSYYHNDRLASETGRDGAAKILHSYDAAGNPFEDIDGTSGHTVAGDYYLDGLPRTVRTETRTNLQNLFDPQNATPLDTTRYGYNGAGLPISRHETGTQDHTTKYTYNDAGLISELNSDLETGGSWKWTYDAAGRPVEETAPNGYKVTKTWRADDTLATQRLVNNAQTVLADWTYHHDELYRQKSQDFAGKDANGVQGNKNFSYTYWPTGELKAFNDGTATQNVTWDPDGNRLSFGPNVSATYNADDSVKSSTVGTSTATFEYLPFGGVARDGACNTYDGFDRLISIRPPDPQSGCGGSPQPTTVEYSHDALDRQRSRKTPIDNKTTTFRYDGRATSIAGEKKDTAIFNYLLDPAGGKQAVTQTGTPGTEFLFDDGYGNMSTVMKNGAVECAVRYDPFGDPINPQNSDNPCHTGTTTAKAFYRGGRRDETTGRYQLGSRTYDPKTSSFLTPDSYRTGGSAQNLSVGIDPLTRNSYSYVNGDPVNLIDPSGHDACRMEETREAQLQCVNARSQERGGRGVRYFETKGDTTIHREPDGFAYHVTKGEGIDRRDITQSWQWNHGSAEEKAYAAFRYGCGTRSCTTPRAGSRLWNILVELGKSVLTDPIDCAKGVGHLDPRFECVGAVPAGKLGKLGQLGKARRALGAADDVGGAGQVTVLGRYRGGTEAFVGKPGFNVLDLPAQGHGRWYWSRNRAFIDDAIGRGDEIRLVTDPHAPLYSGGNVYQRELRYLRDLGYRFEHSGDYWVAVPGR
jgi:RHS repeat-associated protein/uncharacterized repeat protein (TIGR01451 family)